MLSNTAEIDQTLHHIEYAKQSLRDEKVFFNEHIKVVV